MNSTDFLLLANNNTEVDGNQISLETIDFQPHPSNLTPVFESLDQEMDLTIRSLNFRVGSSGSTRLSDLAKLDPSASETKTITVSGSSVGSSSEVNLPISFTTAENTGEKIEELDETTENLDIGGTVDQSYPSQKDFITQSSGVSNNIHQLCVIITEAVEENDDTDNIATRKQDDKSRSNSKKIKEQQQKEEGKNPRLHRRVEDYHVSHQSRH
jgi:hypothetical protein